VKQKWKTALGVDRTVMSMIRSTCTFRVKDRKKMHNYGGQQSVGLVTKK